MEQSGQRIWLEQSSERNGKKKTYQTSEIAQIKTRRQKACLQNSKQTNQRLWRILCTKWKKSRKVGWGQGVEPTNHPSQGIFHVADAETFQISCK